MIKHVSIILLIIIIISYTTVNATAASFPGIAVYRGEGFIINVNVETINGNGSVIINGVTYDQLFKHSIEEACYLAAMTYGLNPYKIDFIVNITWNGKLRETMLKGSSLSLSVYIATLESLKGGLRLNGYTASGMVNPDGSIGFVSLLKEKIDTAAQENYIILIPFGEEGDIVVVNDVMHIGPYAYYKKSIRIVEENISSYNTVSIASILDAYNIFTNITSSYIYGSISVNECIDLPDATVEYLDSIIDRADNYLNYAKETYNKFKNSNINYAITLRKILYDSELSSNIAYKSIISGSCIGWPQAYNVIKYLENAAVAFYYSLFINRNSDDIKISLSALEKSSSKLLEDAYRYTPTMLIPLLGESAIKLHEARYLKNETISLVLLGMSGLTSREELAYWVALRAARADALFTESMVLSITASSQKGYRSIGELSDISRRAVDYAWHLALYAKEYAISSKIYSNLTVMAGDIAWRAKSSLGKGVEGDLRAIGYSIRSIALASLYFALHPDPSIVSAFRYEAALRFAGVLYGYYGHPLYLSYELRMLSDNITNDIYYIERLIAGLKIVSFSGDYGGGYGVRLSYEEKASSDTTYSKLDYLITKYKYIIVMLLSIFMFLYVIRLFRF